MKTYYLVTVYTADGRACYTKVNSFDKAVQICDGADFARIQKRIKGQRGCAKYVYEKFDEVVTTY